MISITGVLIRQTYVAIVLYTGVLLGIFSIAIHEKLVHLTKDILFILQYVLYF